MMREALLESASKLGLPLAPPSALTAIGSSSGIAQIATEEHARAARGAAQERRNALVTGPVLSVPTKGASFSFDPTGVTSLPPDGSVYRRIRVAADWGVLEVNRQGLLSRLIIKALSSTAVNGSF